MLDLMGSLLTPPRLARWTINLINFSLVASTYAGSPNITFALYHPSSLTYGKFTFRGGSGVWPNTLNLGSLVWNNDGRQIIYEPSLNAGDVAPPPQQVTLDWYHPVDRSFRSRTSYFDGESTIYGGPLRVLATPVLGSNGSSRPSATALLGSGSTTYTYEITTLDREGNECSSSSPFTIQNAASLSSGVATNKITWTWSPGIVAVNIYGRAGGSTGSLATVTWDSLNGNNAGNGALGIGSTPAAWVDNGSITPGAPPPTTCKSGSIVAEGSVSETAALSDRPPARTRPLE